MTANPAHALEAGSTEKQPSQEAVEAARRILFEWQRQLLSGDVPEMASIIQIAIDKALAALPREQPWGIVFHDEKQVWQIIGKDGRLIIDGIGEFRFRDNKSEREAVRRLAEQIRDNHNAEIATLPREQEDTERLDWLEKHEIMFSLHDEATTPILCGFRMRTNVRDAIDAARATTNAVTATKRGN